METVINILYCIALAWEYGLGVAIVHRLYPEYRSEKKVFKWITEICIILMGALYVWNFSMTYISNGPVIVYSILFAIVYFSGKKSKFAEVSLIQMFYYLNLSILKLPVLTIRGVMVKGTLVQMNCGSRSLFEVLFLFVIVSILTIIFRRGTVIESYIHTLYINNKRLFLIIIIIEFLMEYYGLYVGKYGYLTTDLIVNLIILFAAAMIIMYLVLFNIYQKIRDENILQQIMRKNYKQQYDELKELYDLNNQRVHDIRHEMIYICNCLDEGEVNRARESLEKYIQKTSSMGKKVWTGFAFLDFLLNYKKSIMDKKRIRFEAELNIDHIPMREEDLILVLGNLLDNAIEAAEKCETADRVIKLKIYNRNELILLYVENSSTALPEIKDGKFISSKSEEDIHGLGIESVRKIVESYEGEIQFEYTKNSFQVQILI